MSKTITVHNMFSPCYELGIFNEQSVGSSYCRLVDAKIRFSDKYLPVHHYLEVERFWLIDKGPISDCDSLYGQDCLIFSKN